MCVAWIRILFIFLSVKKKVFFFFIFINIRTQTLWEKNMKKMKKKAKCVTKDRTAATQSFGKVFGASSDSI